MSSEEIFINGELLRLTRESRGWALGDLATRACMSVKQIRQLEEGGMSSFYSAAVKTTSAKKVGHLLGLPAEAVFAQEVQASAEPNAVEPEVLAVEADVASQDDMPLQVMAAPQVEVKSDDQTQETPLSAPTALAEETKSKTSLWVIAGLFVSALGVAAYMQPQDEPAVDAAPPLQVLPADVAEPSSAASAADVPASAAEAPVLPASSVATSASAPRVSAQAASGVASVMAVRPASAIVTTPAVSATNKAP
jgi:transcriptional regulator with XRE-family HTH domain